MQDWGLCTDTWMSFSTHVKTACIKRIPANRHKLTKSKRFDTKINFKELWYRLFCKSELNWSFSNWSENHLKLKTKMQARHSLPKYGSTYGHNFNKQRKNIVHIYLCACYHTGSSQLVKNISVILSNQGLM